MTLKWNIGSELKQSLKNPVIHFQPFSFTTENLWHKLIECNG